jgi:hypothetical protein
VQDGSADLSGAQGESEHILVAMEVGTFNVQKATCDQYCVTCDGIVQSWIVEDPFAVSVDYTHQLLFQGQYNTAEQYDLMYNSRWSSSDSSVAAVNGGLVQPSSGGTLTAYANNDYEPLSTSGCYAYVPLCPLAYGTGTSSLARCKFQQH